MSEEGGEVGGPWNILAVPVSRRLIGSSCLCRTITCGALLVFEDSNAAVVFCDSEAAFLTSPADRDAAVVFCDSEAAFLTSPAHRDAAVVFCDSEAAFLTSTAD